jgi:hypothetical protein
VEGAACRAPFCWLESCSHASPCCSHAIRHSHSGRKRLNTSMYLVELGSNGERRFATRDDFATAIRAGEIHSRSYIYHHARSTWIPITWHPIYKRLAELPPLPKLPPLQRRVWTFFRLDPLEEPQGEAPPVPKPRPEKTEAPVAAAAKPQKADRGWAVRIRLALGSRRAPGGR